MTSPVAVVAERNPHDASKIALRLPMGALILSPSEAVAIITALLSDGEVHAMRLHGRPR